MTRLTVTLIDKDTKVAYHKNTLNFTLIEDALNYIKDLQKNLEMKFTVVRYTITVK